MPKKGLPGYLKHKKSNQAFCKIGGKFIYLGRYNSKISRERYEEVIAEYLANDKKLPQKKDQNDTTIAELAIAFLEHAEEYYPAKNGKTSSGFWHCNRAIKPVVQFHGNKITAEFTPLDLKDIQKLWINEGHARKTINRWTLAIKQMFDYGVTYGFVSTDAHYKLSKVPNLKEGHTAAPEYDEVQSIDPEIGGPVGTNRHDYFVL